MKRILSIVSLTMLLAVSFAVTAHAKQDTMFDTGLTYVGESENKDSDIDTKIQRTLLWINGRMPIAIEKNFLFIGLSYEGQFIHYEDFATTVFQGKTIKESDLPDSLHALDVPIGFLAKWNDKWSTLFEVKPGIHSDFKDISSKDVMFQGSALALYKFSQKEKEVVGFGLAFSQAMGTPSLIPLVKLNWYPTEKYYVEALLPLDLDAGYRFNDKICGGLEGKLRGYLYRLSDASPWDNDVLRFREVRIGPYADYAFTKKAHLRVSAGAVVGQKFEIRDDNNDDKLADGDYENTGYLSVNFYVPF